MKKISLIFTSLLILSACNSNIKGEGAATANIKYNIDDFEKLEIECNCSVTILPSDSTKVVVESHQNLIDNLAVKTSTNSLYIKDEKKVDSYDLYNVLVYTSPNLQNIILKGETKMKISGTLKTEKINIEANNHTLINEAYIDTKELKLNFNDNSEAEITGSSIFLEVNTKNATKVNLEDLSANEVEFSATDNSKLNLYPRKELKGKASNNAIVNFKGDPNKSTETQDRAEINKL